MAKHIVNQEFVNALAALGIGNTDNIRRVVIDVDYSGLPIIYVEHFGTEKLVDVVRAMSSVEVKVFESKGVVING